MGFYTIFKHCVGTQDNIYAKNVQFYNENVEKVLKIVDFTVWSKSIIEVQFLRTYLRYLYELIKSEVKVYPV